MKIQLPPPARYFPPEKGVYEVAANLRKLGTDYGNGVSDTKVIQIDSEWERYRSNKLQCHQERVSKYYCHHELGSQLHNGIVLKLIAVLTEEWPELFTLKQGTPKDGMSVGDFELNCHLSGERLMFSQNGAWLGAKPLNATASSLSTSYQDGIDALCCQFQEDLAIMSQAVGGNSVLRVAHICSAGHWAPEEKIGRDFVFIHQPVPGSGPMNRGAAGLVEGAITKGPFVRFTWSIVTDLRLNHHTVAPPGIPPEQWDGRSFDPDKPELYMRVERQILVGLPELRSFLFFIRPLYTSGESIRSNGHERQLFASALESMSPESRAYKGIQKSLPHILRWLNESQSLNESES
jgi:hypothetical protein